MLDKDTKKSLSQEIATRRRAEFMIDGLAMSLPNPDPVLKRLGRDISVYRELLNDPAVKGATRRRRSSVKALEYGLTQNHANTKTLQLCEQVLATIKLKKLIGGLHDAAWFGYSPAEINWQAQNSLWLPSDVVVKPPEWFCFDTDNQLCFKDNSFIKSNSNSWGYTPVPVHKFIVAQQDATYANPYGVPDMAAVYWAAVFKKGGLKYWLRFADKFGQAFVIGKHPRGTPDAEIDMILDSLELLSQDGVGAFPDDGSVEILEAGGKQASADLFERLLMFCRSEINIALLGQNQGTEKSSTNASAMAGLEVTQDIRDADADFISDAVNDLLKSVVLLNIGDNEPLPTWEMWELEDETEQLSQRDERLAKAGANFTAKHFIKTYGFDADQVTNLPTQPTTATSTAKPMAFSEFSPVYVDYAEANSQRLATNAKPAIDDWLIELKALTDTATSLPDLQDKIAHAFSELDPNKLMKVMEVGFLAAELAGMAQVAEEAKLSG